MRPRAGHPALCAAVLFGAAGAALALTALDPNALCLLPALALAAPLILRRYPGARTLVAFSSGPRRSWQRARSSTARAARAVVLTPRGGLLLARSLAVRPPPAVHCAAS